MVVFCSGDESGRNKPYFDDVILLHFFYGAVWNQNNVFELFYPNDIVFFR